MSFLNRTVITSLLAVTVSMAGCNNQTPVKTDTSKIPPAENQMVILPENMHLGLAVIHPPRAKDGFGSTEVQTVGAFNGLQSLLKKQNMTLANVMRVRATLAPGADGRVDYDGFVTGFNKFYGTKMFPNKPAHSITAVRSFPVNGQNLILEVEIAVPNKTTKPDAQAPQDAQ